MTVSKDVTHLLLSNIPRAPKTTDTTTLRNILAAAGIERTPRAVQLKLQELCGSHPIRSIETSKP
jgi:hypothetical protein